MHDRTLIGALTLAATLIALGACSDSGGATPDASSVGGVPAQARGGNPGFATGGTGGAFQGTGGAAGGPPGKRLLAGPNGMPGGLRRPQLGTDQLRCMWSGVRAFSRLLLGSVY